MRDSLLDLYMLSRDYGVSVAGWEPPWRYVWPRDSALVVSAFMRTGHVEEAERNLDFLQRVQPASGVFAARYLADWSGKVPDQRGEQLDGSGWALWALGEVERFTPPDGRMAVSLRYRQLLLRSTDAIIRSINRETGLPRSSPDYWEIKENKTTLATSAVSLAGLQSAVEVFKILRQSDQAAAVEDVASALDRSIAASFGSSSYSRYPGGRARNVDLGVTFLQTPFATFSAQQETRSAWSSVPERTSRPAGGLSPGGGWRNDGISWTASVATYAVAAACIEPSAAVHWLTWLDAHRTPAGALPEKVLADGSPASAAPLAWTSAAVIIAGDELERGC